MADDITSKHLARLRVRGAPSTIPGAGASVGEYDAHEVWRNTSRILSVALPFPITGAAIREAFGKLQRTAESQKLTVLEDPMFAVKGDPMVDPPNKRPAEAILTVRGATREDGDVKPGRLVGGMHIVTVTPRGLGDLERVYTYLFGKFLPARKQELMRPYLLHRIVGRLDADDQELVVEVAVPATLSIKPVGYESAGGEA